MVNITNSGGSALTDYQVLVTLNTTNFNYTNASADGSDLRFTNYANTTKYNYWIEDWNTTGDSKIWVNVSSVPASTSSKMYMWYNNFAASSESNGHATFEFFDDLETFNLSEWVKQYASSTLSQVGDPGSSGRGDVLYYYGSQWRAFKKNTYTFTNGTIHFEFYRLTATDDDELQFCWRMSTSDFDDMYEYVVKEDPAGSGHDYLKFQKFVNNGETNNINVTEMDCPDGQWHDGKIFASGSYTEYWLNGAHIFNFTDTDLTSGYLGGRNNRGQCFNNVFVCKYASTEPTTEVTSTVEDVSGPVIQCPSFQRYCCFRLDCLCLRDMLCESVLDCTFSRLLKGG